MDTPRRQDGHTTVSVVLLRAVNIGAGLRVTSADLRKAADDAGLADARTLLNSGNLVVSSGTSHTVHADDVARLVQERLTDSLGQDVTTVGLSAERLEEIAAANPFPVAAREDPSHLQVHFHSGHLDKSGVARFDLANPGRELIATAAGVLYVHYVDGIGRSHVTPKAIDQAAGVATTARNWNTLTKLRALCTELAS